uniref:NADH dehydrogenase subunit 6 n=1 Tax=Hebardina concinna TaxID=1432381 RepID=UPI0022FD73DF|nr:NADH dehydrogenase subunit 6 [Hebardina concinna]WAX39308.1 NADH dehydrogenase subunit 6 [Hebardina concinna]
MKNLMLSMLITTSILFMQMNHPLAMGLILLIQTLFTCMMSGLLSQSFWFSYILFMIFLGGMLILFIYVTSLASNEMFFLSTKTVMMMIMTMLMSYLIIMKMNFDINNMEMLTHENIYMMEKETLNSLMKLYNQPTNMITIMLASYLFLTLIAVVKITNISKGPLRQMN